MHSDSRAANTREIAWSPLVWVVLFCVYWCLCGIVLWWAYDTGAFIHGGAYTWNEAFKRVIKMGLIMTILTSLVWFIARRRKLDRRSWRTGWSVAWETFLILVLYCGIVLLRRQLWDPEKGNPDTAFLPIVGPTNGHFFSEFLWLGFLFPVAPVMGLFSGLLYYLEGSRRSKSEPLLRDSASNSHPNSE